MSIFSAVTLLHVTPAYYLIIYRKLLLTFKAWFPLLRKVYAIPDRDANAVAAVSVDDARVEWR